MFYKSQIKRGEAYAQNYGPRFCEISDKIASNVKEQSIDRAKQCVKTNPRRDLRIMRPRTLRVALSMLLLYNTHRPPGNQQKSVSLLLFDL